MYVVPFIKLLAEKSVLTLISVYDCHARSAAKHSFFHSANFLIELAEKYSPASAAPAPTSGAPIQIS
jgi:hypothetical protein